MSFYPFRQHLRSIRPKATNRKEWAGGLRLDRAEVPFPPSPAVIEALRAWPEIANRYPDPDCQDLRASIAAYTGCQATQVVIGNGSDEIIDTVMRCCLDPGDKIVVPVPTFYFYQRSAEVVGGHAVHAPMTDRLELDVDAILSRIAPRTKAIFIANPNNPTGKLAPSSELLRLVAAAPCLVCVDECYFEFAQSTVWPAINNHENLLIIRSFSKAFGLAAVRLGYAIGNEETIRSLHSAMQPFPVSGAAQVAGIAALSDLGYMRAQIDSLKSELQWLSSELSALGFRPYESGTNFILVNTAGTGDPATQVVTQLRERGVYVWDCTGAPGAGDNHFRISTGSRSQNEAFLKELRSVLSIPAV